MPSCQNFKQKIAEFKKKTEELRGALEQYKNGQKEYLEIFEEDYKKLGEEIEKFRDKEYAEKVIGMIKNWYPFGIRKNIINLLEFEKDGRLTIKKDIVCGNEINFFLNLIKKVNGNIDLISSNFKQADNLEVVVGYLNCIGNKTIQSFKKLKTVGRLYIDESGIKSLNNLEEISEDLRINRINNIKTIEDFLKIFSKLKKIGKDAMNISIMISSGQSSLKSELEKLRNEGKLEFEGTIKIG